MLLVAPNLSPAPVDAAPEPPLSPVAADVGRSLDKAADLFGRVLSGRADVTDGDSLVLAGERIRLEGIDAPEQAQTCPADANGRTWPCGRAATRELTRLIAGRDVTCRVLDTDRHDRLIALCRAGDTDLNRAMVESGHAWAFVRYSRRYVAEERRARSSGFGLWKVAGAQPPWEFRARRWEVAESHTPSGCAIKGNITRNGRIYHMPWSDWYHRTRIDEGRGERWFCSEAEALAAGWRPAHPG